MIDRSTLSWAAVSSGTGGGVPCGVRPRGPGPAAPERWLPGLGAELTTRGAGRTDAQRRMAGAAFAVPRPGVGCPAALRPAASRPTASRPAAVRPVVPGPAAVRPPGRVGRGRTGTAGDDPSRAACGVLSTCQVGAVPPDARAPPRDGTTDRPGRNALRLEPSRAPRPGPAPPALRVPRPVAPATRVSVPTDAPVSALADRTGAAADPAHRRRVVRAIGWRAPSRWAAPAADGDEEAAAATAARAVVPRPARRGSSWAVRRASCADPARGDPASSDRGRGPTAAPTSARPRSAETELASCVDRVPAGDRRTVGLPAVAVAVADGAVDPVCEERDVTVLLGAAVSTMGDATAADREAAVAVTGRDATTSVSGRRGAVLVAAVLAGAALARAAPRGTPSPRGSAGVAPSR